jgi:hypothetical protein
MFHVFTNLVIQILGPTGVSPMSPCRKEEMMA